MVDAAAARASSTRCHETTGSRLLIVGLGNPMMADDGVGNEVVRRLEHSELPRWARLAVIDGDVLALTRLWRGERAVWLVDACSGGRRPPGAVGVYKHQRLVEGPAGGISVHHASLSESLRWLLHAQPEMAVIEFRLFAVEAAVVRPESSLSPAVRSAVGRLVGEIVRQAKELGPLGVRFPSPHYS